MGTNKCRDYPESTMKDENIQKNKGRCVKDMKHFHSKTSSSYKISEDLFNVIAVSGFQWKEKHEIIPAFL